MSEEELAELAEVEPAFVQRAVRAGALQGREAVGGFGIQDAARLRFLCSPSAPKRRWRCGCCAPMPMPCDG